MRGYEKEGWKKRYEKLHLSRDQSVRVRQTLSGTSANSKMMAEWALSHALAQIDDDSERGK